MRGWYLDRKRKAMFITSILKLCSFQIHPKTPAQTTTNPSSATFLLKIPNTHSHTLIPWEKGHPLFSPKTWKQTHASLFRRVPNTSLRASFTGARHTSHIHVHHSPSPMYKLPTERLNDTKHKITLTNACSSLIFHYSICKYN